jgi:hypothetical protein
MPLEAPVTSATVPSSTGFTETSSMLLVRSVLVHRATRSGCCRGGLLAAALIVHGSGEGEPVLAASVRADSPPRGDCPISAPENPSALRWFSRASDPKAAGRTADQNARRRATIRSRSATSATRCRRGPENAERRFRFFTDRPEGEGREDTQIPA